MNIIEVQSSNLESIGYDPETEILKIKFLNSSVYEYKNVSQVIYDALMNAPSHGSYFNREIRNNFPYEKVG
jgi:hypothetical protein